MEFIQLLNAGNHHISMWIYDLWGIFKQNGFIWQQSILFELFELFGNNAGLFLSSGDCNIRLRENSLTFLFNRFGFYL